MKQRITVVLATLALVASGASAALADSETGDCNSIVAKANGSAHKLFVGVGDFEAQCLDVTLAFMDFAAQGCFEAFSSGELHGTARDASIHPRTGVLKPLGEVICNAILTCGLCPAAPPDICPSICGAP